MMARARCPNLKRISRERERERERERSISYVQRNKVLKGEESNEKKYRAMNSRYWRLRPSNAVI